MNEIDKPTHYQTLLMSSEMEKLKAKTKENSTLEALSVAVKHYLKCKNTKETKGEKQDE